MPMIIAMCPYCRAGGVRAPDTALGASATCPKCKSSFTVLPSDDVPPGWDKPAPPKPAPSFAPLAPPPDETRPTAAMPDRTEPSPVLPAEPRPARAAPEPPAAAPADIGLVCALGSLCVTGPAMVATLLPYGRAIALALAAVGLGAGALALFAEGKARRVGALAVLLHSVALVVLLFFPRALALDPWRKPVPVERYRAPGAVLLTDPRGDTTPPPNGWIDAATHAWAAGDTLVTVEGVDVVDAFVVEGAEFAARLLIHVRVTNCGAERPLECSGWEPAAHRPKLVDSTGRVLEITLLAPRAPDDPTRVEPGGSEAVTFEAQRCAPGAAWLRLELPGEAVGEDAPIRFQIAIKSPKRDR